jgi:hypothetical protein
LICALLIAGGTALVASPSRGGDHAEVPLEARQSTRFRWIRRSALYESTGAPLRSDWWRLHAAGAEVEQAGARNGGGAWSWWLGARVVPEWCQSGARVVPESDRLQPGLTLVHELIAAGLVDKYRLFVYPVVLGRGRRLFTDATDVPKPRRRGPATPLRRRPSALHDPTPVR